MGVHGEAHTAMVSYSIEDGESTEGLAHGKTARGYGRYRRREHPNIEIVDESSPYPALLGIDWATDMKSVINLKKWKMIFEKK